MTLDRASSLEHEIDMHRDIIDYIEHIRSLKG